MIVAADILDFVIALLPVIFLIHLAFRIGLAEGKLKGGILLFAGGLIIFFSFLFKLYFDFVFGGVDTFWLFMLTFGTAVGVTLALAGTYSIYSFLVSAQPEEGHATKALKISGVIMAVFVLILGFYVMTLNQSIYFRLGGLSYFVLRTSLFGIGIFIGEFFSLVGKRSASSTMRFDRVLASYYLVEPVLWLTVMMPLHNTASYELIRVFLNLFGVIVSSIFAFSILQYVRLYLPIDLRRVRTSYLDMLRIKVLRDFYIIGICVIAFVSLVSVAALSLYEGLRKSTIENYAQFGSSIGKLEAAQLRS